MGRIRSYFSDIRNDAGAALYGAAGLVALGAVLEGIGIVAILPLAALITGNADTETARTILSFMDQMGMSSELSRALALSGGFLILLALRGLVVWKRDTNIYFLGLGYVDRWRSKLFRAIAEAKWSAVSNLRRTDIEHSITNDVVRLSAGTDRLLRGGAAIAMAIVQLGIIALLAPLLLLLVLVLIAVAALVTMPLLRKASHLGKSLTRSGRRIHRVLGDFLASQKLARLNNAEAQFLERFDASVKDVRAHEAEFFASQTAARGWFQFAAGCLVIAALLIGLFLLDTPLSVLAVTLLVMARLVSPMMLLTQMGQAIANTLPAYEALQETLTSLRHDAEFVDEVSDRAVATGPASLKLSGIAFQYPTQDGPTLSEVSFTVEPGEVVALSASSGAGKTTLLDTISGLHDPSGGSIAVDGKPLSNAADMQHWRSQLAYLPQDPFLFDTSLKENLTWSAAHSSEDVIWEALKTAEVADFARSLPDGLDSRAGERGQNLSGGERQRICIARALLRRPRLLILDEGTNALDAGLESKILTNLIAFRGQFSIIFVTHRTETLRHADRVITLSNGTVSNA